MEKSIFVNFIINFILRNFHVMHTLSNVHVIKMFDFSFSSVRTDEISQCIVKICDNCKKTVIFTPNVDHIVLTQKNPDLKKTWDIADILLADGMPLVWLSKLLPGKSLPERVTGADLLPAICKFSSTKTLRIALVGGAPGVADTAAQILKNTFGLKFDIYTYCPPMGFESNLQENGKVIQFCNNIKPNILFLCLGSPKAEVWLHNNREFIDFNVALSVGAAIDFVAGTQKRAPLFLQAIGFEWLWRMMREPRRLWKRYLINDSAFFIYAIKELYISYLPILRKS